MPDPVLSMKLALPYLRLYQGKVFVTKIGGAVLGDAEALHGLVEEASLLYRMGIRLVLVHGGGPQVDALAARLDVPQQRVAGRRVTSADTLEVAKMALAGQVNTDLLASFAAHGTPAIGLSGVDAGLLRARRRPPVEIDGRPVDYGLVGDIEAVDLAPLRCLLGGSFVPVVASLAVDAGGQVLNVNADTIAARLAVELEAEKLIVVTSVAGLFADREDPSSLVSYADLEDLAGLRARGAVAGGMLPKLAACEAALRGGVPRVHLIDGTKPETLLREIFTNEGAGSLLVERKTGALFPFEQGA